jgi:flagellar motor switch protein FliM
MLSPHNLPPLFLGMAPSMVFAEGILRMSEILTQEEIDLLLSAAEKGGIAHPPKAPPRKRQIARYDFQRPSRISKEQLQALQMLHDRFAKLMGISLSPYLRSLVEIRPSLVEQTTYSEYVASVAYPSCIGIFGMKPLKGGALIEIEPHLVHHMIDRILGGGGRPHTVTRELTEIERALVVKLVKRSLQDLRQAWSPVRSFQFELLNVEVNPEYVQLAGANDTVILIQFSVKIGEVKGGMTLGFPYAMLEPVIPNLSLRLWIAAVRGEEGHQTASGEIARAIPAVQAEIRALLGSVPVTVDELSRLAPGDILRLGIGPDSPGFVLVEGVPTFLGKVGMVNGKRGIQILTPITQEASTHVASS